jgi:hypothetical protein
MSLRPAFLAALSGALLGGCVTEGPFPSLAPRPDERLAIEEPVRVAPTVPDDPALRARIAALLEQSRQGDQAFRNDRDAAVRAAARSGPRGSDGWIEAQMALSRLEAARGRTSDAAAELDRLRLERANQVTGEADLQAIEAAIGQVEAMLAEQQAVIESLRR